MGVAYKSYKMPINFIGWKEFKIPYKSLDDSYGEDLTKASGFSIYANGWWNTPNKDSELYIDKILFKKMKYKFNMEEYEIFEENYLNALNKFKY